MFLSTVTKEWDDYSELLQIIPPFLTNHQYLFQYWRFILVYPIIKYIYIYMVLTGTVVFFHWLYCIFWLLIVFANVFSLKETMGCTGYPQVHLPIFIRLSIVVFEGQKVHNALGNSAGEAGWTCDFIAMNNFIVWCWC